MHYILDCIPGTKWVDSFVWEHKLKAIRNKILTLGKRWFGLKRIVTVCLVVCVVLLIGCVKNNYDSFAEVYERGTVTQQLEYAVKNELLEDIGFNSVEYNGGSVGWEISDFEKEVSVVYHINHEKELVGTIKREIDDNELKIDVHDERYDIWLIGNTFSYMCPLSAEDLSLVDDKEYAKDYAMIFKMNSISLEDIKGLLNVYSELSQKYMKTLYNFERSQ